jgi:hypothetical protein
MDGYTRRQLEELRASEPYTQFLRMRARGYGAGVGLTRRDYREALEYADRVLGMVCSRCNQRTGDNTQGHFWSLCKVTGEVQEHHFCCPGDCELATPTETTDPRGAAMSTLPTDHYAMAGVSEMHRELESLLGSHVYLKVAGDTDPTPYQGAVTALGEATVEITQITEEIPGVRATRLQDPEPPIPPMRERTRVRLDHIISVTEVNVIQHDDPDLDPEPVTIEIEA